MICVVNSPVRMRKLLADASVGSWDEGFLKHSLADALLLNASMVTVALSRAELMQRME